MDVRFFSILGLIPGRLRLRDGLNESESHRHDDGWVLGPLPSWAARECATCVPRESERAPLRSSAAPPLRPDATGVMPTRAPRRLRRR